jgi:hypothetical protein
MYILTIDVLNMSPKSIILENDVNSKNYLKYKVALKSLI